MIIRFLVACCLVLACSSVQAMDLVVAKGVITTAVENQQPVDEIESFPADYGKLYCFTRVVGASGDTEVTHIWYYQEHEMARVSLPVRSRDWRTYSSKRVLPNWKGEWRVVIVDRDQHELMTIPFVLE